MTAFVFALAHVSVSYTPVLGGAISDCDSHDYNRLKLRDNCLKRMSSLPLKR